MRARSGGGAAAWVAGVLAAPGTQGSWRLGKKGIKCSRRVWQPVLANTLRYSSLENPPDREAWQATVHRVAKSRTCLTRPCACRRKTFFACGSSALVSVECEGGAAAWLVGTLAAPNVQGHGLPPPQELWPDQSFSSLLYWRSEGIFSQSFSLLCPFRHLEGSLAWGPSLFSASGTQRGLPGWDPTL